MSRAVKAALWRTGDSEWRMGLPMMPTRWVTAVGHAPAALLIACSQQALGASLGHQPAELRRAGGEGVVAVLVGQHVVDEVGLVGRDGGLQRRPPGGCDRRRWQPRDHARVVG